jgi:3-hydroxyisobutyrate dehydrogenase-like beta-hydroxyacid dehydrogenase
MHVGFVGVGNMGGRMARHVAASEHELAVFDPRPERVEELVELGARGATSPADAADGADVVSVVVLNDEQVREAVMGAAGVLQTLAAGAVLAIHSTVTLECLRDVEAAAGAVGVRVLDAGISGGLPGAQGGTLLVIAGGDESTIDAARPALAPWSREIVHCGPIGAGMVAKVARNYVQYGSFGLVHEAQSLAQAGGVDLAQLAHIIRTTGALDYADKLLDREQAIARAPEDLGDVAAVLVEAAELGFKDLDVAESIARELDVELHTLPGARAGYGPAIGIDLQG